MLRPRVRSAWRASAVVLGTRPALPNSAFLTRAASNCCAATLFVDSGRGFVLPGTRPYHLLDFFLIFFAPGVSALTLRDFTNRAPGVSLSQGWPSGPIQALCSQ